LSDETIITEHHLAQADFLVTQLENQMINVFRHITDNRDSMLTMQMLEMLRGANNCCMSKKDLWRIMIYRCSYEEYERCMKGLISADLIIEFTSGTTVLYRLPSQEKARASNLQSDDTIARWESLAHEGSTAETAAASSAEVAFHLSEESDQEPSH